MFWRSKSFDPNSDILAFSNDAHCQLRVLACFEDQKISTQIALCLFSQWSTLLIKSNSMYWRSKSSDLNSNKSYDPNNASFCRSNDAPCQLNTSDQSDPMKASICFQGEASISVLCRSKSFDSIKIQNLFSGGRTSSIKRIDVFHRSKRPDSLNITNQLNTSYRVQ